MQVSNMIVGVDVRGFGNKLFIYNTLVFHFAYSISGKFPMLFFSEL